MSWEGMNTFETDMKKYVEYIIDSFKPYGGKIAIQYKTSRDEIKILFRQSNGLETILILKRDIDKVRFYIPMMPLYKSVDDISSDLYDELISYRRKSTVEFNNPERLFGEWKIDYRPDENVYFFCLVDEESLGFIDTAVFQMIFTGLWNECAWYYNNYKRLSE